MTRPLPEEVSLLEATELPLEVRPLPSLANVLNMAGGENGPGNSVPLTGIRTPHTRMVYSVRGSRLLARN